MTDLVDLMQESHVHRQNFRNGDPHTSREAGRAARGFADGDCADIYAAMQQAGRPLAAEEISDRLGWNNHVRVNRRLAELVDAARIAPTDDLHTNKSGRRARRYRVATA